MKTRTVMITVPEIWIETLGEVGFKTGIEGFLIQGAPCEICGGAGHYQPGNHLSDLDEIGCPECKGKEWENPL